MADMACCLSDMSCRVSDTGSEGVGQTFLLCRYVSLDGCRTVSA